MFSAKLGDITEIMKKLDEYGVVVIEQILNKSEIEKSIDAIWANDELESRGVKRNDQSTWGRCWPMDGKIERKGWIESNNTMFCPQAWRNRFNAAIVGTFQSIWDMKAGTKVDLLVKYDRYGVMRPKLEESWRTDEGWLHTDQNPKLEQDFVRLQGVLTFTDSSESSGGFICVPGFHKKWKEYCSAYPIDEDVCSLPKQLRDELMQNGAKKITAPPGSLIIWDSRLPHANFPNDSKTQFRMVQYITYFPSYYASKKQKRITQENAHCVAEKLRKLIHFGGFESKLMGLIEF